MSILNKGHGLTDDLLASVRAVMSGQPVEEKKMDPVDPKQNQKMYKDRDDKDIDNDGDTDSTDKYLHMKRKAITKATKSKKDDEDGNDDAVQVNKMKEANLKEDDVQAKMRQLMRRDGKDPDKESDGGVFDRYRAMAKKELGIKEAVDLDDKNVEKALKHDCASHVTHEEYGDGECIPGMHTIEEAKFDPKKKDAYNDYVKKNNLDDDTIRMAVDNPNNPMVKKAMSGPKGKMMQQAVSMYKSSKMNEDYGIVTHYDVMFKNEDGPFIVENVPVTELKIIKSSHHGHARKKDKGDK